MQRLPDRVDASPGAPPTTTVALAFVPAALVLLVAFVLPVFLLLTFWGQPFSRYLGPCLRNPHLGLGMALQATRNG